MPQGGYLSLVLEGLGTKSVVAQRMYELTGNPKYFAYSSRCALMMIINDLITSGALPFAIVMYLAAGTSEWFKNKERAIAIAEGFRKGCELAGSSWIGGETPVLKGIIRPGAYDIAGSAIEVIEKEEHRILGDIKPGDVIIGFSSEHSPMANGYTLIRQIGDYKDSLFDRARHKLYGRKLKALENGYLTDIGLGVTYGDAVLRPTPCYASFIRECQIRGIRIKYAINVTGHGWRKFMRANLNLTHRLRGCYKGGIFEFIQEHGPNGKISNYDMYSNFNMGVGFAAWVDPSDVEKALDVADDCDMNAFKMGISEDSRDNKKSVVIEDLDIVYKEDTLAIR